MQKLTWSLAVLVAVSCAYPPAVRAAPTPAAPAAKPDEAKPGDARPGDAKPDELKPEEKTSRGSVTVGGRRIDYTAVAGTLVVHPKGAEDNPPEPPPPGDKGERPVPPAAAMSYVAYFQTGADSTRPVMFLYNGGPGSATVWLHMGAFGPRRVVTSEDSHTPAAPGSRCSGGAGDKPRAAYPAA